MADLYTRTMGALPLSIGTSLALESIFIRPNPVYDPKRVAPQVIDLSQYQECWFNLETMVRNIAQSSDRVNFQDCTPQHVLEILLTEIDIINSLFQTEGAGVCKPVFFFCTYKSVRAHYKARVNFRESTTLFQRSYDHKAEQVLRKINSESDEIFKFDSELKPALKRTAMIITHYPIDLIWALHFRKLDLLESHTGLLKTRTQWNTKYYPFLHESMSHLPFHRDLLFVFGDKSQIEPQHRKVRQAVYDLSIKDHWTPFTTMSRVRDSYRQSDMHPADKQFLMSF